MARARPAAVRGPVLRPPCSLQRPLPLRSRRRQGEPALVLAPHPRPRALSGKGGGSTIASYSVPPSLTRSQRSAARRLSRHRFTYCARAVAADPFAMVLGRRGTSRASGWAQSRSEGISSRVHTPCPLCPVIGLMAFWRKRTVRTGVFTSPCFLDLTARRHAGQALANCIVILSDKVGNLSHFQRLTLHAE